MARKTSGKKTSRKKAPRGSARRKSRNKTRKPPRRTAKAFREARLGKARTGKAAVVKGPGKRLAADQEAVAGEMPQWTTAEIEEAFRRFAEAKPHPEGELKHVNPFTL